MNAATELCIKYNLPMSTERLPKNYGKYLDLVFCTMTTNLTVSLPSGVELTDENNLHHNAVNLSSITQEKPATTRTYSRIKLKQSNVEFATTSSNILHTLDFTGIGEYDVAANKITKLSKQLKDIQIRNTTNKVVSIDETKSQHPWTKCKLYNKLDKFRKLAKKCYSNSPTELYKLLLRQCNVNLYDLYKKLNTTQR